MSPERATLDQLRIDRGEAPTGRQSIWIVLAVAVAVAAGAAWWLLRPRPVVVRTAPAREVVTASGSAAILNASGYVTARRQATVSSKVTGKVVEVLIEEGMEVEEGQVLARLDASNVQASLALAEASAAAAEAALGETEVELDLARADLARIEGLIEAAIATDQDLDRARAGVAAFEARLDRLRRERDVADRQVRVERQALEDTIIRAPFAGRVVAKNAQPGEMISPISAGGGFTRTGIGTIVDMSSLEIEVDVNEAYINRVTAGQGVEATLDAYPDWQIPAHVIAIVPTADRERATVKVRIGFEKLDPRILPDMGVKVALLGGEGQESAAEAGGVLVPRAALRDDGGQDIILVASGERVERRAVRIGRAEGNDVEVTAGLSAGERVVIEGPPDLADGQSVREEEER